MTVDDRIARLCAFVSSLPEPRRPPLVLPEELGVTVEDIFHHVDPAAVPEIADVLEWLAEKYPQTLAAVGDVDRSLIWGAMEESPFQRLAHSAQMARFYERLSEQVHEHDRHVA